MSTELPRLWVASRHLMPYEVGAFRLAVERLGVDHFTAEKDAISLARKLRIEEIDRLQNEVDALDARYDAIENEEVAREF